MIGSGASLGLHLAQSQAKRAACIMASLPKGRPLELSVRAEGKKAHISIEGSIWGYSENSSREFKRKISDLIADGINDVHVYINSYGGDVFEANEIVNEIKRFTGNLTGEGGAVVASAATYIAVHIDGFSMAENGSFMIHKPYAMFDGTADEIESNLKLLRNLENNYLAKYAAKTGKTPEAIKKLWDKGDYWMSAEEAKTEGFIDAITGETEITEEMAQEMAAFGAPNVMATVRKPKPQSKANQQTTHNVNELQILALSLGLSQTADLSAVQAHIKSLQEKAGKYDTLKAQVEQEKAEADRKAAAEAIKQFNAAFDAQVNAKAITEDYRVGYLSKFNVNAEATIAEIKSLKPVPNITDGLTGGGKTTVAAGREKWTYTDWAEKDNKGLMAMAKSDSETFKALFKAEYGKEPSEDLMLQISKS